MNFVKKTFRSILGLSNSEDQPTAGHRALPSPGVLALISKTADIKSPATILESVSIKPTLFSVSTTGDGKRHSTAGVYRPVDSPVDIGARSDWFSTVTEVIGIESGDLTVTEVLPCAIMDGVVRSLRTSETMRREEVRMGGKHAILPPLMSSLKENGQPRFNLWKVRKDGRLQISKVPNYRPEILRLNFPEEDRMKIRFIYSDLEEDEDEEGSSREETETGERGNASDRNK